MESTKSERAIFEAILTLFFIYLIGAGVTIFGYSLLSQDSLALLSKINLAISALSLSIIFVFSFIAGLLKRFSIIYGLLAALLLNLTVLPLIIYTAPVHAIAIQLSHKANFHYFYVYAIYIILQFAFFGMGLGLSMFINLDGLKNKLSLIKS